MPAGELIRPARLADDDGLVALDGAAADPGTFVSPPGDAPFFGAGTRPEDVLVAERDGRIVGYAKVRPPTPLPSNAHVQQVQGLAVHPSARGYGLGGRLLAAAVEEARRRGARKLSLRVLGSNPRAQALYRAAGFEVEGVLRAEFRLDDGTFVDDVLMARPLN